MRLFHLHLLVLLLPLTACAKGEVDFSEVKVSGPSTATATSDAAVTSSPATQRSKGSPSSSGSAPAHRLSFDSDAVASTDPKTSRVDQVSVRMQLKEPKISKCFQDHAGPELRKPKIELRLELTVLANRVTNATLQTPAAERQMDLEVCMTKIARRWVFAGGSAERTITIPLIFG
jgi:hypothetical protein